MGIVEKLKDVNFSKWKFVADKSYAYDTIYFMSKFIREWSENWIFNRTENWERLKEYTCSIFNLDPKRDWIFNYYNETINVLEYSDTIDITSANKERLIIINDDELLEYISTVKMENAYIYLYLLCYFSLKNSNILDSYIRYIKEEDDNKRRDYFNILFNEISNVNVSVKNKDNQRWQQCTKYIVNIMNFMNDGHAIARSLKESKRKINKDAHVIAVNVDWTKTKIKKDNWYIDDFDYEYVEEQLDWYLFV